ncbi:hypothetical protein HMPREF0083_00066 [Aneurinibacillus aneurinilyticus ATCC 12856]|uniref:Uncharacterized protein n=1 Tax=Aneurinibacillus aneurinilyticus ATCC 12856 TaxID=649747 RepID=U1WTA3_ANEAE|nr:hypothetical protein HMPREF0083_00066 [Aneurinibacillus aneurinilyticus ATCC 12856]
MIIHKVEERRCTRRRVPSSFSRGRDTAALWRWIILDNQHP